MNNTQERVLEARTKALYSRMKSISICDFACLMAGYHPDDVYSEGFYPEPPTEVMDNIRLIMSYVTKETLAIHEINEVMHWAELFGHKSTNRVETESEAQFTPKAYKNMCDLLGLDFPLEDFTIVNPKTVADRPKVMADDDLMIIDGVTVGDMRKIFGRGAPLDDIVRHLIKYSTFEPHNKNGEMLFSGLNAVAKKGGWGMATDRGLSNPQKTGIDMLFFPNCAGGRGNAKDYTI